MARFIGNGVYLNRADNPKAVEWLESQRSKVTTKKYGIHIVSVLGENPDAFLNLSNEAKERILKDWIAKAMDRLSSASITVMISIAKSFMDYHGITGLNWTKIKKRMPVANMTADDRPPTREEIVKVLAVSDTRLRSLILLLVSSGVRVGAIPDLKMRDLQIKEVDGKKVGILKVYRKTASQYTTFVSTEAISALELYWEERKVNGESLTDESPLIRDSYEKSYAHSIKSIGAKHIKANTFTTLMTRAWIQSGARKNSGTENRRARHDFKTVHGFRKYFKTVLEGSGMKTLAVERLMGHSTGLSGSYFKPTEAELLENYVKHMPALFVTEEYRQKESLEDVTSRVKTLEQERMEWVTDLLNPNKPLELYPGLNPSRNLTTIRDRIAASESAKSQMPKRQSIKPNMLDDYLARGFKPIFQMADGTVVVELG